MIINTVIIIIIIVITRCETVNSIVALLSINFHALETDVKKEQQMRQKVGGGSLSDSILISNLSSGPSLEFERSDATRKLRLVLSELLTLMYSSGGQKQSELFDHQVLAVLLLQCVPNNFHAITVIHKQSDRNDCLEYFVV